MCPSSHTQSCSCNEIGTILCAVPDAKWLWLQTCFPYCHYWGYCSGLITSWLCQPVQRELNHAPPPPPHVYLSHFHLSLPPLCNSNTLLITLGLKDLRNKRVNWCLCSCWRSAQPTVNHWTRILSLLFLVLYLIQFAICGCRQTLLATRRNHLKCNNGEWAQLCTYWLSFKIYVWTILII